MDHQRKPAVLIGQHHHFHTVGNILGQQFSALKNPKGSLSSTYCIAFQRASDFLVADPNEIYLPTRVPPTNNLRATARWIVHQMGF